MAEKAITTSRRAILGALAMTPVAAAAATLPSAAGNDRLLWDRRFETWLAADLLKKADQDFGPSFFTEECVKHAHLGYRLNEDGSCTELAEDEKQAEMKSAYAKNEVETKRWLDGPSQAADDALTALLMTPAPDLSAVMIKSQIMKDSGFWMDDFFNLSMKPYEIIRQDIARLGGKH